MVRSLADAQEAYYLANGSYATDFADLAVQPPAGGVVVASEPGRIEYKNFYCRLFTEANSVYCAGSDAGYYAQYLRYGVSSLAGRRWCVVNKGNQRADQLRRICQSYGGEKIIDGTYEFWTMP